ncbi:hypothetical protein BKA65DRAFT_557529 [Rhexocercosporidium sp. MPI-PUGE-AT-0058]|nr:hypothetical protein BKA65DRAFT_557529 [Rhexocercosporidium sp. MPI-PUGE-AT-0058]
MSSYAPSQEVASTAAATDLEANSQSANKAEPAPNSDVAGVSNTGKANTAAAGEEEGPAPQAKEPSEKFLTECETVEEVLDALSDGFNKHQDNLSKFDFKPNVDFRSEEILTSAQLFESVGQKAFNAGFRRAKEDAAELRLKRRMLDLEQEKKAREAAIEEAARRSEEELENGYTDEERSSRRPAKKRRQGLVQASAAPAPVQQIAVLAQVHDPVYHAFGAVPGLYLGTGPPNVNATVDASDNNSVLSRDNSPSPPKKAVKRAKPAKKSASMQSSKKTPKAKSHEKALVGRSREKQRTAASKSRNDWGIPRPYISKADFFALRRHAKLTTKAFEKLGPNDINNVKLTHREAIRFSNASDTWTYVKEVGVDAAENKTIDDHLYNWELVTRRKIRRKLKLRVQRQQAGDFHDSDSSISDDEGQYGSDIDRDEVLDSSELIVDDDEEEEEEEQVRRTNKGKGRAVLREEEDSDDEENEDKYEDDAAAEESQQASQDREESPEESEEDARHGFHSTTSPDDQGSGNVIDETHAIARCDGANDVQNLQPPAAIPSTVRSAGKTPKLAPQRPSTSQNQTDKFKGLPNDSNEIRSIHLSLHECAKLSRDRQSRGHKWVFRSPRSVDDPEHYKRMAAINNSKYDKLRRSKVKAGLQLRRSGERSDDSEDESMSEAEGQYDSNYESDTEAFFRRGGAPQHAPRRNSPDVTMGVEGVAGFECDTSEDVTGYGDFGMRKLSVDSSVDLQLMRTRDAG